MRELKGPLGIPGVCLVCETAPLVDAGVRVVDTELNLISTYQHHLSGRKYVCQNCVAAMVKTLVPELNGTF